MHLFENNNWNLSRRQKFQQYSQSKKENVLHNKKLYLFTKELYISFVKTVKINHR